MSPSSLKRINKEIKNFNEKTYSTNIFSHKLLAFLGNLNLTIISVKTNNNSNNDEYFLLIKATSICLTKLECLVIKPL